MARIRTAIGQGTLPELREEVKGAYEKTEGAA
jgi:hypothetical protein